MNKYRYLIENVLIFGIGNVLSKVVAFFLLSLFTKYLTPSEFGEGELIVTTITLIVPILTLCISDAVMRYLLDNKSKEEIVTNGVIITIGGFCILLFLSPIAFIIDSIRSSYSYIILLFLFNSLEQLFFNIDKGLEYIKVCALNSLVSIIALVLSSYIFIVVHKLGLQGYLLSIIMSHATCSIFLFVCGHLYSYLKLRCFNKKLLNRMLTYSLPLIPSVIAWWLNSISNRYLIVFYLGSSFNGLFSAAAKIPNIISIFTTIFHQAWTISGIKEFSEKSYSSFYSNVYNIFTAFMFILCSILILTVPFIGELLFLGDFYTACFYVPFMIAGALFSSLCGMLQPAFLASEKTGVLMLSTIVGVLINIIFNIIFLQSFGLQVASVTSFLSFFVVWIIRWNMAKQIVIIEINWTLFISSLLLLIFEIVCLLYHYKPILICILITVAIIIINICGIITPLKKTYLHFAQRINFVNK